MNAGQTLLDAIALKLSEAARVNHAVQAKPSAVLWPDAERQWEKVVPALRERGAAIATLGPYDPAALSGPAIWLKCVVAHQIEDPRLSAETIIVYLPGVGRVDLRAIETCPRELQPLAELQYRGAFWSQVNGKDWSPSAFLGSSNNGLGLDVATDRATQDALAHALESSAFLQTHVDALRGREINAEWLENLVQPNFVRELLEWLNDPAAAQSKMSAADAKLFSKRCKSDFGLDPAKDGVLVGFEKLAAGGGRWDAVWQTYSDGFSAFPKIAGGLADLKPPMDLFQEASAHARFPAANKSAEDALRSLLLGLAGLTDVEAREKIRSAEADHGQRRNWLWTAMGQAPLADSLAALLELAESTSQLPAGDTPEQLGAAYAETGWRADAAAIRALGALGTRADTEAVGAAVRAVYLPWLRALAERFQGVVRASARLGERPDMSPQSVPEGCCTVFVDGLRYDVAQWLCQRLANLGDVSANWTWTSRPSVTASGKAWCSPVASLVAGTRQDVDFQPRIAADGREMSTANLRRLLSDNGFQVLTERDLGDPARRAWVECGDLDHFGHQHGLRLARDMDSQLSAITERLAELAAAGWQHFRIVTDHGWLLMPGGLPKAELSKHQAETRWGRCAVLKEKAHATDLTMGWDWCDEVQIAYAPDVSNFKAGEEYAHGGLTLQECLVPVIEVRAGAAADTTVQVSSITWKGLRCQVTVEGAPSDWAVDIRTRVADANSSIANAVRKLEGGKASLAVADDDNAGIAAVVVVLDAAGTVKQKQSTTVGGGD